LFLGQTPFNTDNDIIPGEGHFVSFLEWGRWDGRRHIDDHGGAYRVLEYSLGHGTCGLLLESRGALGGEHGHHVLERVNTVNGVQDGHKAGVPVLFEHKLVQGALETLFCLHEWERRMNRGVDSMF
jgi:hypothetical protein